MWQHLHFVPDIRILPNICILSQYLHIAPCRKCVLCFIEHLRQRQHDSDENVRMDVVQAIVGAAKRVLANVTEDLLECVKERTLDKKVPTARCFEREIAPCFCA